MTTAEHAPIHHDVDLSARLQHLVRVTTTVPADLAPGARVMVATWTPGSYVERDYVHHLQSMTVADEAGASVVPARDGRTAWLLPDDVGGPVTISTEWYANELTVRTNHVDDEHALLVPPATFPLIDRAGDRRVTVAIAPTPGHTVWGLLPRDDTGPGPDTANRVCFVADDQLHLVDSAFEVGDFRTTTVDVRGIPHTWVHASTGGPIDLDRIGDDVRRIALAALDVVGGELPIDRYTFLCVGAGKEQGGGGLEHRDGSVLMLPVMTDADDDGVARTRSLIAHEYFHLWNVKRLVPAELVDLRLDRPVHTTSLWVAEGWTAYYDDLLPVRAGLTTATRLLKGLRDNLTWVRRTPGAARQPLVESSWRAWTGLYVRDENSVNAGTSYYTHGAVVALLLDLLIRRAAPDGDGLDEAFRLLWQRFGHPHRHGHPTTGYHHEDVVAAVSEAAGTDLSRVITDHVEGTGPPPVQDVLDVVGCRLVQRTPDSPAVHLGIRVDEDDRGPVVTAALRDGPAWTAGVTGGDRLVAVDGTVLRRGELDTVLRALEPGRRCQLTIERAHRVRQVEVVPGEPLPELRITPVAAPTAVQAATFERWAGVPLASVDTPDGPADGVTAPGGAPPAVA